MMFFEGVNKYMQLEIKKFIVLLCVVWCASNLKSEVRMLVLRTTPLMEDVKLVKGTFGVSRSSAVKKVYLGNEKGETRGKDAIILVYDSEKTGKEEIMFTLEKLGYKSTVVSDVQKPKPSVDGMTGATGY